MNNVGEAIKSEIKKEVKRLNAWYGFDCDGRQHWSECLDEEDYVAIVGDDYQEKEEVYYDWQVLLRECEQLAKGKNIISKHEQRDDFDHFEEVSGYYRCYDRRLEEDDRNTYFHTGIDVY